MTSVESRREDYQLTVSARIIDFCRTTTPWYRRLWAVGTLLALREAVEGGEALSAGVITPASLRTIRDLARSLVAKDPALTANEKEILQRSLSGDLHPGGHDSLVVSHVISQIESGYLTRWASIVDDARQRPDPEAAATAVGTHLLDSGLSEAFLDRWWQEQADREPGTVPLGQQISQLNEFILGREESYEVMVPFAEPLPGQAIQLGSWRDQQAVREWLEANGVNPSDHAFTGGFVLSEAARDPEAAIERAAETIDRMDGLLALSAAGAIKPLPFAWIAGTSQEYSLQRSRRFEVPCLSNEMAVYDRSLTAIPVSALELLGVLGRGDPAAAVTASWAALEALLIGPGDSERVVAADRLASIVACVVPRAELADLGRTHMHLDLISELSMRLRSCQTPAEKANVIAKAILADMDVTVADPSDELALRRMRLILNNPRERLAELRRTASTALRRLYRQRNLVLHWGRMRPVALRPAIRTAAPLIGAGVDRIVSGWLAGGDPLRLAARAHVELNVSSKSPDAAVAWLLAEDPPALLPDPRRAAALVRPLAEGGSTPA
jgi:hypothetical protein